MIWIIIFIKCDGDDNNNTTTYLFNFNICSCFSWIRFYFSDYLIWLVIIHGLFFRLLKTFWILSPCTKNIFLNASRSQLNRSSRHKDVTILILLFNIYYLFVYVSSQYIFLVVIVFFYLFVLFLVLWIRTSDDEPTQQKIDNCFILREFFFVSRNGVRWFICNYNMFTRSKSKQNTQ